MARSSSPSPRRLRDARPRGHLVVSRSLVGMLALGLGFAALVYLSAAHISAVWRAECVAWLSRVADPHAHERALTFHAVLAPFVSSVAAFALTLALAFALAVSMKTRSWLRDRDRGQRANHDLAARGLAGIVSARTVVAGARVCVAAVALGAIAWFLVLAHSPDVVRLARSPAEHALALGAAVISELVLGALVCALVLHIVRHLWRGLGHALSRERSVAERRREDREYNTHPAVAARRRERWRRERSRDDRSVLVLVTGRDTAVILAYRPGHMSWPRVLSVLTGVAALAAADRWHGRGEAVYRDPILCQALAASPGEIPPAAPYYPALARALAAAQLQRS